MAETAEKVAQYLGMGTRPVGVKLFTTEADHRGPGKKRTFCQFVYEAARGQDFVIAMDDLNCLNAEVALGFREPKYVEIEPRIKSPTKAIRIGPVEEADVVLFILNPEQVMTMSILLEGITARFKGDMAVCGEGVAYVKNTGEANVTFLCNGARMNADFQVQDVILSLPYVKFMELPTRMGRFSTLGHDAKQALTRLLLRLR